MSVAEAYYARPAAFWAAWVKQNQNQVLDKQIVKDGAGGAL